MGYSIGICERLLDKDEGALLNRVDEYVRVTLEDTLYKGWRDVVID